VHGKRHGKRHGKNGKGFVKAMSGYVCWPQRVYLQGSSVDRCCMRAFADAQSFIFSRSLLLDTFVGLVLISYLVLAHYCDTS